MCNKCNLMTALMREQWIKLHLNQGISIPELAKQAKRHENTLYLWKTRYLEHGLLGLLDKSRAPHSHANEFSKDAKKKIKLLRLEKSNRRIIGPLTIKKRLFERHGIKASRSGIAKFLNKEGLIKNKKRRTIPKNKCLVNHADLPGELIQIDIKYAVRLAKYRWLYQFGGIDAFTRIKYGWIYEHPGNYEAVQFLKQIIQFLPFNILAIKTDNAAAFTNRETGYQLSKDPMNPRLHVFDLLCLKKNIEHYLIDKGKPQQNGKIERSHRTDDEEFYNNYKFKNISKLRKDFKDYLKYYNHEREHQGINNMTPIQKLRTISEYSNIKELIIN